MSNKINTVYNHIKQLDDNIKKYEEKIKKTKEEKKKYETYLINKIGNNNVVKVSDNKNLKVVNVKRPDSITQKLIKEAIIKYYSDKTSKDKCLEEANNILKFILSMRGFKNTQMIKMYK